MGRRADPRDGVDGQADVAGLGEGRPPGMDADPDAQVDPVGPCVAAHGALDGDGRVERRGAPGEGGEEFVAASVDLAAPGLLDGCPEETAKLVQHRAIAIAKPVGAARSSPRCRSGRR